MNKREEAQKHIDSLLVAEIIQNFWEDTRDSYGSSISTSALCAIGPLQTMIGLAIKNGHLAVHPKTSKPVAYEVMHRNEPVELIWDKEEAKKRALILGYDFWFRPLYANP